MKNNLIISRTFPEKQTNTSFWGILFFEFPFFILNKGKQEATEWMITLIMCDVVYRNYKGGGSYVTKCVFNKNQLEAANSQSTDLTFKGKKWFFTYPNQEPFLLNLRSFLT